jgi:adenine-specific DNA-methyltransferase
VDPVALHIHERVSPQAILRVAARQDIEPSLFGDPQQAYHEAVQFYRHEIPWTNRLILGDSLQVMTSLSRREDLAGKVQMIYMDPPYGIRFASNFQPEVGKRDVKEKEQDLTREPEMVKGVSRHVAPWNPFLPQYLRDRLTVSRELLTEEGSIFVQISAENLHRVRTLLDEIFGSSNSVEIIAYRTKNMTLGGTFLEGICDYILWYAKDKERTKFRRIFQLTSAEGDSHWNRYIGEDGVRCGMSNEEVENHKLLPKGADPYQLMALYPAGSFATGIYEFDFQGKSYNPPPGRSWKTPIHAMTRLASAERIEPYSSGETIRYLLRLSDYPVSPIHNIWTDTPPPSDKRYVVQTSIKVIQRCLLMTTDPW